MVWKPDYITGEQLGSWLKIEYSEDADSDQLAEWATAASRCVDGTCGRQFGKVDQTVTRRHTAEYSRHDGRFYAPIADLYDTAGLVVTDPAGTVLDADDFELWPLNALLEGRVYERISVPRAGRYSLASDKWGWPAVPASVSLAAKIQGARFAFRRGAAAGIAGSPNEQAGGGEVRLLAKLDPDLVTSVAPYRRKWWAA